MSGPLRLRVTATGTDIGKTWITRLLVAGLRALERRVWLWKPVACGDWMDDRAEDVRTLAPLVGDGQTIAQLCRHQWPEPASPHRAAAAAGDRLLLEELRREGVALAAGDHDLVVEGAGGLLSPLTTDRATAADLAQALGYRLLIVTGPDLGTFHHTAAVIEVARGRDLPITGLVVNHLRPPEPSVAVDGVAEELAEWCALPLLAEIGVGTRDPAQARALADRLVSGQAGRPG